MKALTLRKEICTCDKSCSTLFDGRKIIATSWVKETLPKCWKKNDLLVIRVDRSEADAEMAEEMAYKTISTVHSTDKGASHDSVNILGSCV